ncbi:MAG: DNA alkylation repair protein [bacterium]
MCSDQLDVIRKTCRDLADSNNAADCQRYFKTGPGEYAEGDIFLGIRVPTIRSLARRFVDASHDTVIELLHSKFHEERLLALIIWTLQFEKSFSDRQQRIYEAYLANTKWINNWDLVDLSAYKIVGAWLDDRDKSELFELARSTNLWERRISIVSTMFFIRKNRFDETIAITDILIDDTEDLIHKAVGWMLREVGKRDVETLTTVLKSRYRSMPRTMLRYAIEKFDKSLRQKYLQGSI